MYSGVRLSNGHRPYAASCEIRLAGIRTPLYEIVVIYNAGDLIDWTVDETSLILSSLF